MWPDVLSDWDDSISGTRVIEVEQMGDDTPCHLPSTEKLLHLETAFLMVLKKDQILAPE